MFVFHAKTYLGIALLLLLPALPVHGQEEGVPERVSPDAIAESMALEAQDLSVDSRFGEAQVLAYTALQFAPDNIDVNQAAMTVLMTAGDYSGALRVNQKLQNINPDGPNVKKFSGLLLEYTRQYGAAEQAYTKILKNAADDTEKNWANESLGRVALHRDSYAEAFSHFALAASETPIRSVYEWSALAALKMDRSDDALTIMEKCEASEGSVTRSMARVYAMIAAVEGDALRAKEYLEQYESAREPTHPRDLWLNVDVHLELGELTTALEAYEKAEQLGGIIPLQMAAKGVYLKAEAGQADVVKPILERKAKVEMSDWVEALYLAKAARVLDFETDAEAYLLSGLVAFPNNIYLLDERVSLRREKGDDAMALVDEQKAVSLRTAWAQIPIPEF